MRLSFFVRQDQMAWANNESWRRHMTRSQWFREYIDRFKVEYEKEIELEESPQQTKDDSLAS